MIIFLAILGVIFLYLCTVPFVLKQQFLIGGICLFLLLLISRSSFFNKKYGKFFFLLLATFITVRYLIWRTKETLVYTGILDYIGTIILYLAETHGILLYLTGIFISIWPIRRKPVPIPDDPEKLPTVDVLIPTLNEPEQIVRTTLIGCKQIDYPKEKLRIYLLDDGATLQRRSDPRTSKEAWERYYRFKKMAESLGVNYITRERNEHAKAGNINYALKKTNGELILILDSDHVPTRDILKKTVGWFLKDEKLFLVQTPHFFINPDPVEKNLRTFNDTPTEQQMFYQFIQLGLDFWNSTFFCGSAAILRRKYLEEIGGLKGETITEDAETSIELHAKGLNSAYIPIPLVCGLNPETYDSLITQRTRWTQGMIQILLIKNPLLVKGLKVYQKICYLNCCLFWFFGISRMIFLLVPAAYLIAGLHIYHASVLQAIAYALPHVLSGLIVGNSLYGSVRWPFFSELYESAQSVFLAPATFSAIKNPKKPSFKVTPKGLDLRIDFLNPLGKPFYLFCIITLLTFPAALIRWFLYPIYRDVILICAVWSLFNLFIILACLGVVWERRQLRRFNRAWAEGDLEIVFDKKRIKGKIRDISLGGIGCEILDNVNFKKGQRIFLFTEDRFGDKYELEAEVVRVIKEGKRIYLGCQFIVKDDEMFNDLVKLVYGDSHRWIEFWKRKSRRVSVIKGFNYFLKKGIEGSLENLKGLFYKIATVTAFIAVVFISEPKAEVIRVSLMKLTPKNSVTLKGTYSYYTIKIPIPERWKINKAILKLRYVNSSLLSEKSALVIKINGYVLAQIRLNPFSTEGDLKILIPGSAFFSGYNDLTFSAILHYQEKELCEDPYSPELWTTLYFDKSYLEVNYTPKDIPLRISSLCDFLFDPKIFPEGKVNFVLEKTDPQYLRLAGIIASGISLRFDYRDVVFSVSGKIRENMENVLIGKDSFVKNLLGIKEKIKGAYLRISYLPCKSHIDKKHALLIVSGRNLNELECASKSFALISFPFPDSDRITIKELKIPEPPPYCGKHILRPGYRYTFKELGFSTHTFKKIYPMPKDLIFYLPSDLLIKPNRYADLYLHFSYGAGMRSDSVLNILLNGKHIMAIHLDNPHGMVYENYKISIPAYLFKRGMNKITFMPVLTPSITGECEFIQTENLFLTIFSDSSFYFPSMPHLVDMPRIELFFQDGFPLTRFPDASESVFYLTSQDNRTFSAFLNLIGLLTKKIGYPLLGVNIVFKKPDEDKEILILGPIDTIPSDFREKAPLKLLSENRVYYPIISLKGIPFRSIKEKIKGFFKEKKEKKKIFALSRQVSSFGEGKGLIMEFESPYKKGRTIIVFTAKSSSALEKMTKILMNPSVQAGCYGDISLIELNPPYKVESMRIGKVYYIGKFGKVSVPSYYLRKHFYVFFIILFVTVALLSFIILLVLRRYRRKRVKDVEEYIED